MLKNFLNKIKYIITSVIVLSFIMTTTTLANDELQIEEINSLVEDVGANIKEIPTINSRHAVVYDRTSRKSIIWEKRKRKMQDGIYYKNYDSE